ncbi:unnamed protein product [Rotaria socialis]|uniref:Uncharacterized protein n=1 Tax=Rotaria socialis TaxID=392032 RepID=A0A817Q526_9BILA|nr:unnamed protein product [Rotaria socialis]
MSDIYNTSGVQNHEAYILIQTYRIRNGAKKLAKARTTTQQGRLDSFFTVSHNVTTTTPIAKKAEIQNATNKGLKRKKDATPKSKASGSGFAKKHK